MSLGLSYSVTECRLCNGDDLERILNLKPTPAGNNFLTLEEKNQNNEPIFPLKLLFCNKCFHIQLGEVVDPTHLFKENYHFVSGTSPVNVKHFENYAEDVISRFNLKKGSFILDVGSNDGTCLNAFKKRGMRVLGVDPAENIAAIANKNGIETISEFFSSSLAKTIKDKYGNPDLITSHNVLAHIEDFHGVIRAISELMNEKSVFIFEVGYFREVFNNLYFDTIYHEHLDYHTVTPLVSYFEKIGMSLFDVEEVDIQGGSLRNFVQLNSGEHVIKDSVLESLKREEIGGFTKPEELKKFQANIDLVKKDLVDLLNDIKNEGKSIAAYGAPTKSTTLMNYFDLNNEIIDYIVDDNPLKQNKYSPLLHIPVVPSNQLFGNKEPDYLLILAWNFAESIIGKVKKTENYSGKYIIPLPSVKVLE
tara:strand:+ start:2833 stop:4092 length:1260 start_codon:yes stop_codon:yes gene_type:complete